MSKLVLIDGNAIMHRAYHALPPLTAPNGELINAVYGFVSMLFNLIENLEPRYLAVCFDRKEKTFRKKAFPEYQAHRPVMHEDLSAQFGKVQDFLKAAGIKTFSMAGYEADDLLGSIATNASEGEDVSEVVIVTGDKDLLQMVGGKIKIFMPQKGLSEGKIMREDDVIEKMGVPPNKIPDLKGLIGDSSDNYKGVDGIGPKTAIKILNEYGSFSEIFANIDNIQDKIADKLRKGKDSGEVSYKLARIITDLNVENWKITDTDKWKLDNSEVLTLFESFGFKSLSVRLKKLTEKIKEKNSGQIKLI